MELIDSHCHLDFPEFDADRSDLMSQCFAQGIKQFIVPGVDVTTFPRLLHLRDEYPQVSIAFGLHPYYIDKHQSAHLSILRNYCENHHPVAVGEIGLDFFRKDLPKEKQIEFFQAQLHLAEEFGLPVILHVRKAHQDVLQILKHYNLPGGIAHAFNGSYEQALQYIAMGFKLGFGGAVTFPNARKLRSLVKQLPLDCMVLETDSPDMKPANYIDARNTPLSLLQTLDVIAEIQQVPKDIVAKTTSDNVRSIGIIDC